MEQSTYAQADETPTNGSQPPISGPQSGGGLSNINYNTGNDNLDYFKAENTFQGGGNDFLCDKIVKYVTRVIVYVTFVLAIIAIIISAIAINKEAKISYQILTSQKLIPSKVQTSSTPTNIPHVQNVVLGTIPVQTENGCPNLAFYFPRNNQVSDYVQYIGVVPNLYQATACYWIETKDYNDPLTGILSYASSGYYNDYLLGLRSATKMLTFIRDADYEITIPSLVNGTRVHMCHWFSSTKKQYGLYINGVSVTTQTYPGYKVNGRGTLILGQEQDSGYNRGFDVKQSLHGNLTNFMIWSRVLSATEVHDMAFNCSCPQDYSLIMSLDKVNLHGITSYSIPETCPTVSA